MMVLFVLQSMCVSLCVCERESVCVDMMALFVSRSICVSVCEGERESVCAVCITIDMWECV